MSEFKQIKTRIWQDNWFLSLNVEEKLLWFFLLTHEYSHISGLFEMPYSLIEPLTNIKNYKKILDKFEKENKIRYIDGWIYIINKTKHQPISKEANDNVNKSIKKYFEENKEILAKIKQNNKTLITPSKDPINTLLEVEVEVEGEVRRGVFSKPSISEIENYCKERNNNVDPEMFFDFYSSKGWKVGNTPMKDWKACVRTWEKRNNENKTSVDDIFDKL